MKNFQRDDLESASTMVELNMDEMELVSGGVSNDAAYGASVGVAVGLLALGVAASPILAAGGIALFVGGSIAASGVDRKSVV